MCRQTRETSDDVNNPPPSGRRLRSRLGQAGAVHRHESEGPGLVPDLFLGFLQQFIRVDADRAADCDVFSWIEQPVAGFVRRDEPLGLAKAFGQLGLGQARFDSGINAQGERGLVEIRIE